MRLRFRHHTNVSTSQPVATRSEATSASGKRRKRTLAVIATAVLSLTFGATAVTQSAGTATAATNPALDAVMKATGQLGPHRIPGHYFTSPTPPRVQQKARPKAVMGPSTPIILGNSVCTVTVAGFDRAGSKIAITAGHCGKPGTPVKSMDAGEAGVIGHVVKQGSLDYAVIKLRNDVQLTRAYGRAAINRIGGPIPAPGQNVCKTGISTGTKCGPVIMPMGQEFTSHFCGSHGDSGAPVYRKGRLVGMLNGGFRALPSCTTPLQGPLHSPAISTSWNAVKAGLNASGGVGAGFRLP